MSYGEDPQRAGELVILEETDEGGSPNTNKNINLVRQNHYYPYGLKHQHYNIEKLEYVPQDNGVILAQQSALLYKFKYNGQEWQEELGLNMYDMPFRDYDPAIARWVVIDPVDHFSQSVYNAYDSNPVFWADASGADVINVSNGVVFTGGDAKSFFNAWVQILNGEEEATVEITGQVREEYDAFVNLGVPHGGNDYFDVTGTYLYTKNSNTNNIYILIGISQYTWGNTPVALKDFQFDKATYDVLSNIATFYARAADLPMEKIFNSRISVADIHTVPFARNMDGYYDNGNYNKGVYSYPDIEGSMAIMNTLNNIITVNLVDGKINPDINNKYAFMSVLRHEGGQFGHLQNPDMGHYEVYQHQLNDLYTKLAGPAFINSVIKSSKKYK